MSQSTSDFKRATTVAGIATLGLRLYHGYYNAKFFGTHCSTHKSLDVIWVVGSNISLNQRADWMARKMVIHAQNQWIARDKQRYTTQEQNKIHKARKRNHSRSTCILKGRTMESASKSNERLIQVCAH